MKNITAVTHLTLSIADAHRASKTNHNAPVTLGKCDEGTCIVIRSRYPNRRHDSFQCGYHRFGARKAVWVETRELPFCSLATLTAHGRTLDEAICREVVNNMTDTANASANARISA